MNTIKNKNQLEDSVIGNSVIVQYGNYRTYHIDDIMFKMTPNSTFMKNGKQITYKAYYKSAYNITIKDNSQPLLLSIRKQKDSDGKVVEFNCYLVPELCKMTGMTDKEKNNWKIMQNVA
jgi:aubergine-like protein